MLRNSVAKRFIGRCSTFDSFEAKKVLHSVQRLRGALLLFD
jgi:hypothetical protein